MDAAVFGDRLPEVTQNQRKLLWVRKGCQASQRKGLTSREVQGNSGEVRGTFGEVWETFRRTSALLLNSTVRELPGKSPGNFRGTSRKSGDLPEAQGSLTPSQRLAKFVSNTSLPWPIQPIFAVPALRELESACRVSILWDAVTVPTGCFAGFLGR